MKRFFSAYIIIVILLLQSCSLDRFPETSMDEGKFWNPLSAEEFEGAANQLYVYLAANWGDNRADDLFRNNYPNDISAGTRKVPATDTEWSQPYKTIFWANRIIENDPSASGVSSVAAIRRYIGEAYFFRAYAYFQLVCRYGGVPLLERSAKDINDEILFSGRASREDVMKLVYSDLDKAAERLPLPSEMSSDEFGRVTRTAALALKARAALYEGTRRKFHGVDDGTEHLKTAVESAREVMESGEHELYTEGTQPYRDLFSYAGEGAPENIFVKLYGYPEVQILTHNFPYQYAVNYGASRNFLRLYLKDNALPFEDIVANEMTYNDFFDNRDPRLAQTCLRRGEITYQLGAFVPYAQSRTGFGIRKWVRNDGLTDQPSTLDFPLLRYAEVLLTYAEAKFELEGSISDEDLNLSVNLLRKRAGMPDMTNSFITGNALDMRTELRRERSVELAFEGHRYDDLIRWKEAENLLPQAILGAKFIAGEWGGASESSLSDKLTQDKVLIVEEENSRFFDPAKDYLYPIPSSEIAKNRNNMEQNPNWK